MELFKPLNTRLKRLYIADDFLDGTIQLVPELGDLHHVEA